MTPPDFPGGTPTVSLIIPPLNLNVTSLDTTRGWPLDVEMTSFTGSLAANGSSLSIISGVDPYTEVEISSGAGWPARSVHTVAVSIDLRLALGTPDPVQHPSASGYAWVEGQFSFAAWTVTSLFSNSQGIRYWKTMGGGAAGGWGSPELDWEPVTMRYVASTGAYPSHVALIGAAGQEWVQSMSPASSLIPIAFYGLVMAQSPAYGVARVRDWSMWLMGDSGMPPLRHRQSGLNSGGPPLRHRQSGLNSGGPPLRHRQNGL